MSVLTHVFTTAVAQKLSALQTTTLPSVPVQLDSREIPALNVSLLAVKTMMTAVTQNNVTAFLENASLFVPEPLAPLVLDARLKTTKKLAPAFLLFKEMALSTVPKVNSKSSEQWCRISSQGFLFQL